MRFSFINFLAILCLVSCTTPRENQIIPTTLLDQPSSIVIARISGIEKPYYIQLGHQGFLDAVVNEAMSIDLQAALDTVEIKPLIEEHYYKTFSEEFLNYKFDVQQFPLILDRAGLTQLSEEKPECAPYEFNFLQRKNNAKYALILDPSHWGLYRNYHGFIPISAPRAWAGVKIYLVNLKDNQILGYYYSQVELPISGNWDQPPKFENAVKAVKQTLIQALNEAHIYFFGWNPK